MDGMNEYVVIDIDGNRSTGWWADDVDHAIEQFRNSWPDTTIDAVMTRGAYNHLAYGDDWS